VYIRENQPELVSKLLIPPRLGRKVGAVAEGENQEKSCSRACFEAIMGDIVMEVHRQEKSPRVGTAAVITSDPTYPIPEANREQLKRDECLPLLAPGLNISGQSQGAEMVDSLGVEAAADPTPARRDSLTNASKGVSTGKGPTREETGPQGPQTVTCPDCDSRVGVQIFAKHLMKCLYPSKRPSAREGIRMKSVVPATHDKKGTLKGPEKPKSTLKNEGRKRKRGER
jgi:hypothetical protein